MMNSNQEIMVTVQCLTYNHAAYIRQCLDGFLMQKTTFKFEVLVHDDASTDGTTEILKEYVSKYPDIIKPIVETENQYGKIGFSGIFALMNQRSKGKYIAFCEGDDYWIDPLKLQKQVDFLESHPDYGMIYTAFDRVDVNGNTIVNDKQLNRQLNRSKSGWLFYDLILGNFIQTLTVMMRKNALVNIETYYDKIYDYPLYLHISGKSKVYFINEKTGCYRITPTGAMHTGLISFDENAKHTSSCAFLALLDGEYSSLPLRQKFLFFIRILYRICFRNIDNKKRLLRAILKA
ncbi:MAG TPA: glycosyltransferase [Candidatus Prevotella avicola]|uniref:Glycosyltransferase n=1 Tax=Candidatus Prevotella avicola TaxID=2838738 RepID=A0A9D2FZW9_9BACT|nr:glycosyltransferase [Candidatus Prevotella avicola]